MTTPNNNFDLPATNNQAILRMREDIANANNQFEKELAMRRGLEDWYDNELSKTADKFDRFSLKRKAQALSEKYGLCANIK